MSSKKILCYERRHKRLLDCYRKSSFVINIPLNKLKESISGSIKVTKNGSISQIVLILFYEMYLQNYTECSDGEMTRGKSDKFSLLALQEG